MNLTVHRRWFTPNSTEGGLEIEGVFQCYTLEPRKNQSQGKPFCIPAGTYQVQLGWSDHFEKIVPKIQNVTGFDGIEIHPGNFPRDTHGCTLVGETRMTDDVGLSDLAFEALMKKLTGETDITITYEEAPVGTP